MLVPAYGRRLITTAFAVIGVAALTRAQVLASPVGVDGGPAHPVARGVSVAVDCFSVPETVTIRNERQKPITIRKLGTAGLDINTETFRVDKVLKPRKSVTYRFSRGKEVPNRLARFQIFDDRSGRDAVEVLTNKGIAFADCGVAPQAALPDSMVPAVFTGISEFVEVLSEGTETTTDQGLMRSEGQVRSWRWEASDPRLSGDVTTTGSELSFGDASAVVSSPSSLVGRANPTDLDPDRLLTAQSTSYELTNAGGGWTGTGTTFVYSDDLDTIVLTGTGGYEGLVAYVVADHDLGLIEGTIARAESAPSG